MIAKYDSFSRLETPTLFLCPPGTKYNKQDRTLSRCLGSLTGTQDEEIIVNFNAFSELNFRIYKINTGSDTERAEIEKIFNAVSSRQLIFIEDIGFFMITGIEQDWDEDGQIYKDVSARSCEIELQNKALPYLGDESDSGITFMFADLIKELEKSLPLWTFRDIYPNYDTIDANLRNKTRTFESIADNQNILSFLLNEVQSAYECVFLFDTLNREIIIRDQSNFTTQTDIHLTHKDLIKSIEVNVNADDIYTAMRVVGNDNMVISPVNPTGLNVIYDYSYYTDWMSDNLARKVTAWQSKIDSYFDEYNNLSLSYYKLLTTKSTLGSEQERLQIQGDTWDKLKTNIVAQSGLSKDVLGYAVTGKNSAGIEALVKQYSDYIVQNGGTGIPITKLYADSLEIKSASATTTYSATEIAHLYIKDDDGVYIRELTQSSSVAAGKFTYNGATRKLTFSSTEFPDGTKIAVFYKQNESETADTDLVIMISDLLSAIDNNYAINQNDQLNLQDEINENNSEIETIKSRIAEINNATALTNTDNFSILELEELACYTFEGIYNDEYVLITDSMDSEAQFEQMKILYDRAWSQLRRVSCPTEEITVDSEGFIFKQRFSEWAKDLETGSLINVEVAPDDVASLFLSNFSVGFADRDFKMTFANRLNKFDTQTLFQNVLGSISKTANTIDFVKGLLYPVKEKTTSLTNALSDMRTLTMGSVLASTDNEITIDGSGYTGKKKLPDGSYSNEQIKIINNAIAFTDDNWKSCSTAIGGFDVTRPDGTTAHVYGINAEAILGDIIIGNELHILGTNANGDVVDVFNVVDEKIEMSAKEIHAITTVNDYTFDENGLKIASKDENGNVNDISTVIESGGVHIKYMAGTANEEDRLTATAEGVVAIDLTAKNFLIMGDHARFEKYAAEDPVTQEMDYNRVGCFYIEPIENT